MKKVLIGILIAILVIALGLAGYVFYMVQSMSWQTDNTDPTNWQEDIDAIVETNSGVSDVDIVLTGSSSPRKWANFDDVGTFEPYSLVNTGFGGSKVADSTYYVDETILNYNPEVVIIWSGTNNMHGQSDTSMTGEETYADFVELYETIEEGDPDLDVVFLPVNPTKARESTWDEADTYNNLVKDLSEEEENLYYVDMTSDLMDGDTYNEEYLSWDGLHLNEAGYEVVGEATYQVVDSILSEKE